MSLFDTFFLTGRRMAKAVYIRFLFCSGLLWWARWRVARLGVVVITLHRVLPDAEYHSSHMQPGMVVRASTFRRFLDYITRHCECVLPRDVTFATGSAPNQRRPRLALTFDDGWKDNFETAFPISREKGILFTVFLCPQMMTRRDSFWTTTVNSLWATAQRAGKLDLISTLRGVPAGSSAHSLIESLKRANPRDRETQILQLLGALEPFTDSAEAGNEEQLLTWSDVQEMSAAGVSFGSHTNTHAILTEIPFSEVSRELRESKSAIEEKLTTCTCFAYPNGDWSLRVRDLVAQAGYQAAFINSPGIWKADSDQLSIPRINLWEGSLTGLSGRFSRLTLEYAIFWKAYRASGN